MIAAVNVERFTQDEFRSPTTIGAVVSKQRHSVITPKHIAKTWNVGLDTAKRTLQVTTQKGIRTAVHPLHRRYRVDHLEALNRRRLGGQWYMDHLMSKVVSLGGNNGAWVYTNGRYTKTVPTDSRRKAGATLTEFSEDVGIPADMRADLAPELTGKHTDFQKEVRRLRMKMTWSEADRKNQNHRAELEIRNLKRRWRRRMVDRRVPKRLWDYGLVYESELLSRIA